MRILLVDDDPQIAELFKALVEPLGHQVVSFVDSRKAAECVEKEKFDGVFLDVWMPYLDGFELARRVRSSSFNRQVPIAMITALDDAETMRRGFKAGVTYFLAKPFDRERMRSLFKAMSGPMLNEKRRHARLPLRTSVTCRAGGKELKTASLNISEMGMLMEPVGGLGIGEEVELEFVLPQVARPVKVSGKVVRKELPIWIEVQFLSLTPEDREAIGGYIVGIARS